MVSNILLLSMPQWSLRMKGSVYFSLDEVKVEEETLVREFFDYSDIKVLSDGRIAVLTQEEGIAVSVNIAYFSLKWLLK